MLNNFELIDCICLSYGFEIFIGFEIFTYVELT